MLKNLFYNIFSVGSGESVFIYLLDGFVFLFGLGIKDLVVYCLCLLLGGVKLKYVVYYGMMKYWIMEDFKVDKYRKGILKNFIGSLLNG